MDGPPANAYYPKMGIADNLPAPNVRSGPFGGTEKVRRCICVMVLYILFS